jgi:hypothetical protein
LDPPDSFLRSHDVVAHFAVTLKAARHHQSIGKEYDRAFDLVHRLGELQPAVTQARGRASEWLEYPWLDGAEVRWPEQHLTWVRRTFAPTSQNKLLVFHLARHVADRFDDIFR